MLSNPACVVLKLIVMDGWHCRVTSLRMLIEAVAWNQELSRRLVERFVCEMVMDLPGGEELILCCFTTMPYKVTMVSAGRNHSLLAGISNTELLC